MNIYPLRIINVCAEFHSKFEYIYIYKNIEHVRILSVLYPRGTINVFSQPMIEQSRNDLMQELTPFLTEFDL